MPRIREADASDLPAIEHLLWSHDLRTEGVLEPGTIYWVAEVDGQVIGAIGLELGEGSVLLRSAIIAADWRGQGLGRRLTGQALTWAQDAGYGAAYCFSTEAGAYWVAQGFSSCGVQEVVEALPRAPQVRLFEDLGWLPDEGAFQITLR